MSSLQLIGKKIGPIGFGLMGLTWRQTPLPAEEAFKVMRAALENGSNFWNAGEFYGPPDNNSLVLLEKYFAKYPEDADKVVLSIKGGMNPKKGESDGSPENTRRTIDDSMKQLKGRKVMDIFEFARRDPKVEMKVTFDTMSDEYVKTGKIGGIALSEVRAETIHEAVKHIKVVAVECELSLFSTEILENGVAEACGKYNIPLVAYSPVGRGMLTGLYRKFEDLPEDSTMRHFPRFQPENFAINVQLVDQVAAMAKKKGCTSAQLAINWVRAVSRRPGMPQIIPIPGSSSAERVAENSKVVELTDEEMAEIDATLAKFETAGDRYPSHIPTNT